eukprot:TRINITY_DN10365_c3_g1_i1.p1 TRINITY_DN10365_c3_g1~~TRINITY_DN10365_c3_g1_i1.p1  ORF type:complete len:430 (-),score=75.08 TRINITY_DN10365_c3_g1_i1:656-1882(-)
MARGRDASSRRRSHNRWQNRVALLGGVPFLLEAVTHLRSSSPTSVFSAFWRHSGKSLPGASLAGIGRQRSQVPGLVPVAGLHTSAIVTGLHWPVALGVSPKHSAHLSGLSRIERFLTADGNGAPDDRSNDESASEELEFARELLARQWAENGEIGANPMSLSAATGWAQELDLDSSVLPIGTVLLANPDLFLSEEATFKNGKDSDETKTRLTSTFPYFELPSATLRTGLPPSPSDSPRRERAQIPVVLIVNRSEEGTEGLLLGAWTGRLLGDLGWQMFMTRPLYFGGICNRSVLSMLHAYPDMPSSRNVTDDEGGLAISSDLTEACKWVVEGPGSPLRFKFFRHCVFWPAKEEDELKAAAGIWIPVRVSRELLLREPDSAYEEPLWLQIAEKAGGKVAELARKHGLLE